MNIYRVYRDGKKAYSITVAGDDTDTVFTAFVSSVAQHAREYGEAEYVLIGRDIEETVLASVNIEWYGEDD